MRSLQLLCIVGLPCIGLVMALVLIGRLRGFLEETPTLSSAGDVQRFTGLVSAQMWGALVQIVLLILPPIIYIAGLISGSLRGSDALYVILPETVVLIAGKLLSPVEKRAMAIPATDTVLERQRDRIVHIWKKGVIPRF